MACRQRDLVGHVSVTAVCRLNSSGKVTTQDGTTGRLRGSQPSSYVCRGCNQSFSDWKRAKAHLQD